VYAITLWRPWPDAIIHADKRIENWTFKPWRKIIGEPIAIHAGQKYDNGGADWMIEEGLYVPKSKAECIAGHVVAVATVGEPVTRSRSPWFAGPYGWPLSNVRALAKPVRCTGHQGIWKLAAHHRKAVRAQLGV